MTTITKPRQMGDLLHYSNLNTEGQLNKTWILAVPKFGGFLDVLKKETVMCTFHKCAQTL